MIVGGFRVFLLFFVAAAVVKQNADADQTVENHNRVGEDKNPVGDENTVNQKADRGGDLSEEQPFGHAFTRPVLPLLVNLFANGED